MTTPGEVARIVLADDEVVGRQHCLPLGGKVFVAAGNPRAVAALRTAGEEVVEADLSEFTKADGGPTSLISHVFSGEHRGAAGRPRQVQFFAALLSSTTVKKRRQIRRARAS